MIDSEADDIEPFLLIRSIASEYKEDAYEVVKDVEKALEKKKKDVKVNSDFRLHSS